MELRLKIEPTEIRNINENIKEVIVQCRGILVGTTANMKQQVFIEKSTEYYDNDYAVSLEEFTLSVKRHTLIKLLYEITEVYKNEINLDVNLTKGTPL